MSTSLTKTQPLPKFYPAWPVDEPAPVFEQKFLPPEQFSTCISSMVRVCADVAPYRRAEKALVLCERILKPMQGLWIYGGTLHIGESGVAAAMRHFKADTGVARTPGQLEFLGMFDYHWHDMEQQPQNRPNHPLVYTFATELDDAALEVLKKNLSPKEYRPGTARLVGWNELQGKTFHPALRDMYRAIFD